MKLPAYTTTQTGWRRFVDSLRVRGASATERTQAAEALRRMQADWLVFNDEAEELLKNL